MLEYAVVKNTFKDNDDSWHAQVMGVKSRAWKDIKKRIMKNNPRLEEAALDTVHDEIEKAACEFIADGDAVNLDFCAIYPSITGSFDALGNAEKLTVKANMQAGTALKEAASSVKPRRSAEKVTGAMITGVSDAKSGTVNEKITPGHNIIIEGRKIAISGDDPSVGLYFNNTTTGERVKASSEDITVNKPSGLIVHVPALSPGEYTLEIVTHYNGSISLKKARSAVFEKSLTVA
jgi:hypothetical protein